MARVKRCNSDGDSSFTDEKASKRKRGRPKKVTFADEALANGTVSKALDSLESDLALSADSDSELETSSSSEIIKFEPKEMMVAPRRSTGGKSVVSSATWEAMKLKAIQWRMTYIDPFYEADEDEWDALNEVDQSRAKPNIRARKPAPKKPRSTNMASKTPLTTRKRAPKANRKNQLSA